MRRRFLPLVVLGLLGLAATSAALSAGAGALPPAWGVAVQVPGLAQLNRGGTAMVNSVSCVTANTCAAGGFYTDKHGHTQAFVVDETAGSWGDAVEVPRTAHLNIGGEAAVTSVSCTSPGNCAAGGYYQRKHSRQAFVVDERSGSWDNAIEVPYTEILNTGLNATVNSVSCYRAKCAAGGSYSDDMHRPQAFTAVETHGIWRNAVRAHGTGVLNRGGNGQVESVSCARPGYCTSGGFYTDHSNKSQAFVGREIDQHWGNAREAPGTEILNSGKGNGAIVQSLSCATAGNCSAGGMYTDSHGHRQSFVVDLINGTWDEAAEVPGTASLNKGGNAGVRSVSCATAGSCAAGGQYRDKSKRYQAFVIDKTTSIWGTAIEIPGIGTLNTGGHANVNSVSCATVGNCTASGYYTNSSKKHEAFVADETNGVWGEAIDALHSAALNAGNAQVESVSCARVAHCIAGGYYTDSHHHVQGFLVGSTPPLPLNPGATSCDGVYGGTGDNVTVPAGATCTLVAGTQVTDYVTVSKGGTLTATGVDVGGVLTISGSATVCESTVGSNVKAVKPGGFLKLGGPDCVQGNTFSHNVLVSHDRRNFWIWHNKVAKNLTVRNSHGRIESIRGNHVRNLLVTHSGPVLIVDNHAKRNLRCTHNKHQRGHGNKARHKNTCPR